MSLRVFWSDRLEVLADKMLDEWIARQPQDPFERICVAVGDMATRNWLKDWFLLHREHGRRRILANIDFKTRTEKPGHRTLTVVRIGTCGSLQPEAPIGTYIASVKSIGFDGLLNYYAGRDDVCDLDMERAFVRHMDWCPQKGAPYVATADPSLIEQVAGREMLRGITIACGGFYGPQGRLIRIGIQDPRQNEKVQSFRYQTSEGELKICNFEMESSALAGLSALLGHRAMTCCMVIANRYAKEMNTDYKGSIDHLIQLVLDRI